VSGLKITRLEPTGTRTVHGFGHGPDGSPVYEWQEPEYPPSPRGEQLRELRLSLRIGLRQACRHADVKAIEWSGLERGWAVADFDEAERLLRSMVKP
jgi:hypothetical protein